MHCAEALINSLNCTTPRHATKTKARLLKQVTCLDLVADALTVVDKTSSLLMRLDYDLSAPAAERTKIKTTNLTGER